MAGATSLVELILKKWGAPAAGVAAAGQSEDADASVAKLAKRGLDVVRRSGDEYALRDTASGDRVGEMVVETDPYLNFWGADEGFSTVDDVKLEGPYIGKGIGSEFYDAVEELSGSELYPSSRLNHNSARLWQKRSPEKLGLLASGLRDEYPDGAKGFHAKTLNAIRHAQKGNADPRLLAGIAGTTAAGLAAPMIKNSGMISAPRSENLFNITMGARDLERRLEGSLASLLFPSGLVDYLETVNRREEDPNAMTRGMALLDVLPF